MGAMFCPFKRKPPVPRPKPLVLDHIQSPGARLYQQIVEATIRSPQIKVVEIASDPIADAPAERHVGDDGDLGAGDIR